MISAQQMKEVINYMFSGTPGFIAPTSIFTSSVASYSVTNPPGSVVLSGIITPNNGIITSWSIADSSSAVLGTGTNNSPSVTLSGSGLLPSTIGLKTYFLTTFYTDTNGVNLSYVVPVSFNVTSNILIGQLSTGVDIILPTDLDSTIENSLASTTQDTVINLFDVVATTTGRCIFVVPDGLGSVTDISDNTNSSVLSQFNLVIDGTNSRKIYTQINQVTPGTYKFKLLF